MDAYHPLFCIVGASGSGKTTLITSLVQRHPQLLEIVPSTTTRRKKPEEEVRMFKKFYRRIHRHSTFEERLEQGDFIGADQYAGEWYGTNRYTLLRILHHRSGVIAVTEKGAEALRVEGVTREFQVCVIEILPDGSDTSGISQERQNADRARRGTVLADHVIVNSFAEDGLDHALSQLEKIVLANLA